MENNVEKLSKTLKEIEKFYKDSLNDIVFVNMKAGKELKAKDVVLDAEIPVPMMLDKIVNTVKNEDYSDISIDAITGGMVHMLAVDSGFKYNEAYKDFLLELNPDIGTFLIFKGISLAEDEDYFNASIQFKASLYFKNDNIDGLYNLARAFNDMYAAEDDNVNFRNASSALFKRILDIDSSFILAYYHIGFHLVNAKEYQEAKKIWIEALKGDLDEEKRFEIVTVLRNIDDEVEFEKGYNLIVNQRVDEGMEILKTLEVEHNDWWKLTFFLGLGHRMREEYDDAIKYFTKTLTLNTGHIETMNEIAVSFMAIGKYEKALIHLKEATRLKNGDPELLCNIGIVYLNLNDPEMAYDMVIKAQKINPDDEIVNAWVDHIEKKLNL